MILTTTLYDKMDLDMEGRGLRVGNRFWCIAGGGQHDYLLGTPDTNLSGRNTLMARNVLKSIPILIFSSAKRVMNLNMDMDGGNGGQW